MFVSRTPTRYVQPSATDQGLLQRDGAHEVSPSLAPALLPRAASLKSLSPPLSGDVC